MRYRAKRDFYIDGRELASKRLCESDICIFLSANTAEEVISSPRKPELEQKLDGRTHRRATEKTKEGDAVSR